MTPTQPQQLELPGLARDMLRMYEQAGADGTENASLYDALPATVGNRKPVGRDGKMYDVAKRRMRWHQQTLKALGLIERVPGSRGKWRCAPRARPLDEAPPRHILLSYSTSLGIALWARCESVFSLLNEPIALCLTSPPYPLQRPRAYGNPSAGEFVDFITCALEPIVKHLLPGGSIALNISNDIFEPKSPARSLYLERTVLALHDRLGLHLMDRLIWDNPCKPPGPIQWASHTRQQLNVGWEPVLWFCNDPKRCFADNRRVLQTHTARHNRMVAAGGAGRTARYGDGAYRLKPASFANHTEGAIPKNVLRFPTSFHGRDSAARELVAKAQLPTHGAVMPIALARFLIEFLTCVENDHLVVDPFAGWNTTGLAAEQLGRRWITTEMMAQYSAASAFRFQSCDGFESQHVVGASFDERP